MKRFLAVFALTPREQWIVIFILVALVAGASIKHYRDLKEDDPGPSPESSPASFVSPTPNER